MKIGLTLCNFESEFVAVGFLVLNDCRYEYPEIRQIFSDKILEYNWQEDQSDLTAIYILRDAMVEISEGIFDYSHVRLLKDSLDGELKDRPLKFIKNNIIKGIGRDEATNELHSIISFEREDYERYAPGCDIRIMLAKEDGEEVR